jgi:signal transduction histidine kinase
LARDLHDGPTQSVAAIAMRINFARRLIDRNPKDAAEELFKIEELARKTTKEIRHMLFTLRPLVLESKGLRAALESMAEKMHETFGQDVLIEVDDNIVAQLDMGKQGVIFNIADEAVNNARKHAQAAHVWVRLKPLQKGLAVLEIRDDGTGFDVEKTKSTYESRGSLGMINLKERAELLNGILQLQSKPGVGTRIQVFIPMTEEAVELLLHRS